MTGLLVFGTPLAAAVLALAAPASWSGVGFRLLLIAIAMAGPIAEIVRWRAASAHLAGRARALAARDYDTPVRGGAGVALIADALETVRTSLRSDARALGGLSTSHDDELRQVIASARELLDFAIEQTTTIDQAAAAVQRIAGSLGSFTATITDIEQSADRATQAVVTLSGVNTSITSGVATLSDSASESTDAMRYLVDSIKSVANKVGDLSTTAEETASAMGQMDVSIQTVERNTNDTAKLSEEVAQAASIGFEAIEQTIAGIQRINASSQQATQVMSVLGAKVSEIGKILQVIDDVAEQTNLLALNAAIIAAQAGEHGKGFAIVADEIKDLAERAGDSTREIADLIKTIQLESANAIGAVERGSVLVVEGVRLSTNAEDALRRIRDSADQSKERVLEIARATAEQAASSKQVTDAIGHIADTVQAIAQATTEQTVGSEQVMRAAEEMHAITQTVASSAVAQNRGSKAAARTIGAMTDRVHQLGDSHRHEAAAAAAVVTSLDAVRRALQERHTLIRALQDSLGTLESSARRLRGATTGQTAASA